MPDTLIPTVVVSLLLLGVVALAIRHLWKERKKGGCSGCGGSCSGCCSGSCHCHEHTH